MTAPQERPPWRWESVGIDWCRTHHGVRNEDETACDLCAVDDEPCELVPLGHWAPQERPRWRATGTSLGDRRARPDTASRASAASKASSRVPRSALVRIGIHHTSLGNVDMGPEREACYWNCRPGCRREDVYVLRTEGGTSDP